MRRMLLIPAIFGAFVITVPGMPEQSSGSMTIQRSATGLHRI